MSAEPAGGAAADGLRVATYNVHSYVGTDGRRDPDRVAAVIRAMEADVVGLQEVEARDVPGAGLNEVAYLAQAVGMEGVHGPTLERDGGPYGNALLTRHPVRAVRRVDLSVSGREPRGVLDVDLDVRGAPVRVCVTHFGLARHERGRQLEIVLDLLDRHTCPVDVLVGDFNEWLPWWRLQRLNLLMGRSPAVRSFPSRWPLLPLDRIWVRPRKAVVAIGAFRAAGAAVASDHVPVVADLRW